MPKDSKYKECPVDAVTGAVLETPEIRALGLAEIRKLMAEIVATGEITKWVRDDDQFLLAFLRARKYKVDKSFQVLVAFTKFWYNPKYKHIIDGLDAESLRTFYERGPTRILPGRDVHGNAVSVIYAGRMDLEAIQFDKQVAIGVYFLAWLLENEWAQIHGASYVETFEGFSLSAAMGLRKALSNEQQKELQSIFMDTFPIRIRKIYVVHQPWYFSMVWAVAKMFFKRKITERVHMLGSDVAALHALVPAAVLPPDHGLGGTLVEREGAAIDRFVEAERTRGAIGGFRVPFKVDAPAAPAVVTAADAVSAAAAATIGAGAGAAPAASTPAIAGAGAPF